MRYWGGGGLSWKLFRWDGSSSLLVINPPILSSLGYLCLFKFPSIYLPIYLFPPFISDPLSDGYKLPFVTQRV